MNWRVVHCTTVLLFGAATVGCRPAAKEAQCWDPARLRVQVGGETFDLPKEVFVTGNEAERPDALGIRVVPFSQRKMNARNNVFCQDREHVPVVFRGPMNFIFRDEGRAGFAFVGTLSRRVPDGDGTPIFDPSELQRLHFVGSNQTFDPRGTPHLMIYRFVGPKNGVTVTCTAGFHIDWRKYIPIGCSELRVAIGHAVLGISMSATQVIADHQREIPPADWPGRWSQIVSRFSSYRLR